MQKKYIDTICKSFKTPIFLTKALQNSVDQGFNQYQKVGGDQRFLHSLSKYYSKKLNTEIQENQISQSQGIDNIYDALIFTFLNENDEVISLSPVTQTLKEKFSFFNRKIIESKIYLQDNKLNFDFDSLRKQINDNTKFIFINDPCYLTGRILTEKDVSQIIQLRKDFEHLHFVFDRRCQFLTEDEKDLLTQDQSFLERAIFIYDGGRIFNCQDWQVSWSIQNSQITDFLNRYQNAHYFTPSTPMTMAFKDLYENFGEQQKQFLEDQKQNFVKLEKKGKEEVLKELGIEEIQTDFKFYSLFKGKVNDSQKEKYQLNTLIPFEDSEILIRKNFDQIIQKNYLKFFVYGGQDYAKKKRYTWENNQKFQNKICLAGKSK